MFTANFRANALLTKNLHPTVDLTVISLIENFRLKTLVNVGPSLKEKQVKRHSWGYWKTKSRH